MKTNTSEIPSKKPRAIPAKVKEVRDIILPLKTLKTPDKLLKTLKSPDKPVKTPAKTMMSGKPTKPTMTANMSDVKQHIKDPEGMGKALHEGMGKKHPEGETKPNKEGQTKPNKEG